MQERLVLEARNIEKSFGEAHVLKDVSFTLREGEIHALMGENGAGKSTLIKIIAGVYGKDGGSVFLSGREVAFSSPKDAIDAGLRVIHQEISLVPTMTVAENIFLGNLPLGVGGTVSWARLNQNAQEVLTQLGEDIPVNKKVRDLTIAEQQIIEIAKALSVRPKVLIMDEPTAALNDQETANLFALLRRLKATGVSIIYITHRFGEMYELADRATILRNGEFVSCLPISEITDDRLVKMMVGEEKSAAFDRRDVPIGEEIFRISNLCVDGRLSDVSLHVNRGELVVVFGLFGAGQNELCRAIFGDLPIDGGEMVLHGKPLKIRRVKDACRQGIGYVSDDRKGEGIIPLLSVGENICLPAYAGKLSRGGFLRLRKIEKLSKEYFDKLGVRCRSLKQAVGSLSGGNQQKCVIGRWMANDAKLLVLNMPTRGVDVGARAEIYRALEDLAQEGVAVLIISLEMPEVLSVADRIYIMREHRMVAEVRREDATQEYLLAEALGVKGE